MPSVETLDEALLGSILSESTVVPDINGGAFIVTMYGVWHVDRALGAKRLREATPSGSAGASPKKTSGKSEMFGLWQTAAAKLRQAEGENLRLQEEISELQDKLKDAEKGR